MPPTKSEWTFGSDDADNPGDEVRVPWQIEKMADGTIWIGGECIGWADHVNVVNSNVPGLVTVIFTVREADVSVTTPVAPADLAPKPKPHQPMGSPINNVDLTVQIRCRCNHSVGRHKRSHDGQNNTFNIPLDQPGSVRCGGNGTGPCPCNQFVAKNLCECGHTQESHLHETHYADDGCEVDYSPCRYPTEMGQWCTCPNYRGVELHGALVFH